MNKILIANRGEIAVRIIKTAKEMGIKTVAIFSTADRNALHVRMADEAVCVGPPASKESYLDGDKIIAFAKKLNVEGIHPGYGFLSENADFAKKVRAAGITFIGPEEEAISTMGSKLAAKDAVSKFNVPMVPGGDKAIEDITKGKRLAAEVGYPILIKASAGGGGKGMRVVENEEEFEEQMKLAVSEATSAFGDGSVFIEKYVRNPRHIEIQILGDTHGNIVYLQERECSIQRRHQKVIEEAPSAGVTPALRAKMGQAAVNVAKACKYVGAGTVEFIMNDQKEFYFLEMNTRLQVEHPVTELITNLDLVEQQIRVARGERLSFTQDDIPINGHSIELRVYAEDPENNFMPDIGKLSRYETPEGDGIRVDDSYEEGMEIPIYYDPMISKLIVHGTDRKAAIAKMRKAIAGYRIDGIKNTLAFGDFVMKHPAFITGDFDTGFVAKYFANREISATVKKAAAIAAAVFYADESKQIKVRENGNINQTSKWQRNREEV